MPYVISYDVGTGGTKAVLVDVKDSQVLGKAFASYTVQHPQPDWAEQNPEDWWRAIAYSTKRLLESTTISPKDISCLTFCTQMLGVVPMGHDGSLLHPAIIWLDSRAEEQAQRIMRRLLGPKVFALVAGCAATGKDVLPKWLWLKEHEPELFAKTHCFLDVGGYLLHRCTGKMVSDWTSASGTGLFGLKSKKWDKLLFRLFSAPYEKMPQLVRSDEQVGPLTKDAASDLGLLAGTPVVAGAGDVPAAAVGSGAIGVGEGHASIGTSGWVGVISAGAPTGKSGIAAIQSADPRNCLLVAETETAGACRDWSANCLLSGTHAEKDLAALLDQEVESVTPGAEGLIFTPWLCGERSPVADVAVRSSFINLTIHHQRAHLLRAVYEGVAYNLRWIIEVLDTIFGFPLQTLRIVGGGAQSDTWMQIIADVTGKRIEVVANPQEAGAIGAACIAAVGLGIYPDFEALKTVVRAAHSHEPRSAYASTYDTLFSQFKQVYTRLRPVYDRLNRT